MRSENNRWLMYLLLVLIQILVCNFINTGPYLSLSLLPVFVLCLPLNVPAVVLMFIAAVSGLAVDWLSEGITGLNFLSLVPVAFIRNRMVVLLFGKDHAERTENFSIRKNGFTRVSAAILICQSVFLLIYIVADGAGTRPFVFNLVRFAVSLVCGYLISLPVFNMLTSGGK